MKGYPFVRNDAIWERQLWFFFSTLIQSSNYSSRKSCLNTLTGFAERNESEKVSRLNTMGSPLPLSQSNRLRRGKMRRKKKKSQQTGINYGNAHKNLHNLKCFRLPPATRVLRSSLNLCGRGGGWPSFLISRCAFHKTLFRRGQVCVASLCNRSKQAGCMLCGLEPFFDNSWWSVSVFAEVVNVF